MIIKHTKFKDMINLIKRLCNALYLVLYAFKVRGQKDAKTTQERKNKLYRKAWEFNRKKYRGFVIQTIRGIEKGLTKDAKKGKYSSVFTTDEDRLDNHYLNAIAFRWLLRYSKYKPTLEDERIFVSTRGTRYIEMMQIKFSWDLSNGHID